MSSKLMIVLESNNDGATTASELTPTGVGGNPYTSGAGAADWFRNLATWIEAQIVGRGLKAWYSDTAVSASTTGTFTGATTAGQALTLNGVTFTARASAPAANEFVLSSNVTTQAANLAAAINASTSSAIAGVVGATSAAGVITLFSIATGPVGKLIAVSENLDNFTLADTTLSTGGTLAHNAIITTGV